MELICRILFFPILGPFVLAPWKYFPHIICTGVAFLVAPSILKGGNDQTAVLAAVGLLGGFVLLGAWLFLSLIMKALAK